MIYLTGDVHSCKLNSWEQKLKGSEIISAKKYLDILKTYKISSTLFINGISLNKNEDSIMELLKYDVEFGGHTYNNFNSMNVIKSYIFRKIFGCIYGPKFLQKKDINKTKNSFEKRGLVLKSWRTHAFGSNNETFNILKENKVMFISDFIGEIKPFEDNGIIHLPINISIDQNTIIYGKLNPENRDPFASCTKGRISPEEWFDILKKRVIENEKNKIDSILLIHPQTMACLDDFKLFKKIVKFLSHYKCKKISEFRIK